MQTQTTRQTIARLIERADDLSYQELEQLLLSYPQEYGEPISQPLLARLILPRLDRLTAASSCEEYLLLTQILLRMSPALLTPKHLVRYADLLDGYLQPLLPTITALLDGQASANNLSHLQTTILRGADLYPYLGRKAQTLQRMLG